MLAESHPPVSTQTGGQTTPTSSQSPSSSPSGQSPQDQQQQQTKQSQKRGQPGKPVITIKVTVRAYSFTFRYPLNDLTMKFFAGVACGHHCIPRSLFRDLIQDTDAYRWLNTRFVTGRLATAHYYDTAHRAYNTAVRDLLNLDTPEGQRAFAEDVKAAGRKVLDSDDPRIKGFLDNMRTKDGLTGRQALERAMQGDSEAAGEFAGEAAGTLIKDGVEDVVEGAFE